MKTQEYRAYDAMGLAELVRKKEVTPLELLDCAYSIYDDINSKINAVILPLFDRARDYLSKNTPQGFFAGVPFLLKDLGADFKGTVTTHGSRSCTNNLAESDSALVTAYKNAGLIIVGKTHTPEFGLSWLTESELFGPCRNPFDLERTAGGSSGGSAAAIVAGIVPMAHASDGGGSIRLPASCCGLFGLKPSRGLIPARRDDWAGLSVAHVITKSVRDSAAMLALEANLDPHYFLKAVDIQPKKLKIAMNVTAAHVDEACVSAVMHAKKLCESLGHTVVADAPVYDAEKMWQARRVIVERAMFQSLQGLSKEGVERFSWDFSSPGEKHTADDVAQAVEVLRIDTAKLGVFFKSYDIFLTPSMATLPPKIGSLIYRGDDPIAYLKRVGPVFAPFSVLANNTGFPAISVPLYQTADGLPVGVQFMGRLGEDAELLALATALSSSFLRNNSSRIPAA